MYTEHMNHEKGASMMLLELKDVSKVYHGAVPVEALKKLTCASIVANLSVLWGLLEAERQPY